MAKHEIELRIDHAINIGNVDIELPIKRDGKAFGRIRINRGTIDWLPAGKRKSGYSLDRGAFADMMTDGRNRHRQARCSSPSAFLQSAAADDAEPITRR